MSSSSSSSSSSSDSESTSEASSRGSPHTAEVATFFAPAATAPADPLETRPEELLLPSPRLRPEGEALARPPEAGGAPPLLKDVGVLNGSEQIGGSAPSSTRPQQDASTSVPPARTDRSRHRTESKSAQVEGGNKPAADEVVVEKEKKHHKEKKRTREHEHDHNVNGDPLREHRSRQHGGHRDQKLSSDIDHYPEMQVEEKKKKKKKEHRGFDSGREALQSKMKGPVILSETGMGPSTAGSSSGTGSKYNSDFHKNKRSNLFEYNLPSSMLSKSSGSRPRSSSSRRREKKASGDVESTITSTIGSAFTPAYLPPSRDRVSTDVPLVDIKDKLRQRREKDKKEKKLHKRSHDHIKESNSEHERPEEANSPSTPPPPAATAAPGVGVDNAHNRVDHDEQQREIDAGNQGTPTSKATTSRDRRDQLQGRLGPSATQRGDGYAGSHLLKRKNGPGTGKKKGARVRMVWPPLPPAGGAGGGAAAHEGAAADGPPGGGGPRGSPRSGGMLGRTSSKKGFSSAYSSRGVNRGYNPGSLGSSGGSLRASPVKNFIAANVRLRRRGKVLGAKPLQNFVPAATKSSRKQQAKQEILDRVEAKADHAQRLSGTRSSAAANALPENHNVAEPVSGDWNYGELLSSFAEDALAQSGADASLHRSKKSVTIQQLDGLQSADGSFRMKGGKKRRAREEMRDGADPFAAAFQEAADVSESDAGGLSGASANEASKNAAAAGSIITSGNKATSDAASKPPLTLSNAMSTPATASGEEQRTANKEEKELRVLCDPKNAKARKKVLKAHNIRCRFRSEDDREHPLVLKSNPIYDSEALYEFAALIEKILVKHHGSSSNGTTSPLGSPRDLSTELKTNFEEFVARTQAYLRLYDPESGDQARQRFRPEDAKVWKEIRESMRGAPNINKTKDEQKTSLFKSVCGLSDPVVFINIYLNADLSWRLLDAMLQIEDPDLLHGTAKTLRVLSAEERAILCKVGGGGGGSGAAAAVVGNRNAARNNTDEFFMHVPREDEDEARFWFCLMCEHKHKPGTDFAYCEKCGTHYNSPDLYLCTCNAVLSYDCIFGIPMCAACRALRPNWKKYWERWKTPEMYVPDGERDTPSPAPAGAMCGAGAGASTTTKSGPWEVGAAVGGGIKAGDAADAGLDLESMEALINGDIGLLKNLLIFDDDVSSDAGDNSSSGTDSETGQSETPSINATSGRGGAAEVDESGIFSK
mmetsp:Transcript_4854/g.11956  ORF Transcript_4854/g.11956 Transcript_4854/m.11956 type:complete len:1215 (-) Transcript_4854:552-4196(-)